MFHMRIWPVLPGASYIYNLRKRGRGYDMEQMQQVLDVEYYLEEKLCQLGELETQDFYFLRESMKDQHSRLVRLENHGHYHMCPHTGGTIRDVAKVDNVDTWAHFYPDLQRDSLQYKYAWSGEGYFGQDRNPESSHKNNSKSKHKVTPGPPFNSTERKDYITETQEFIFEKPNVGDI